MKRGTDKNTAAEASRASRTGKDRAFRVFCALLSLSLLLGGCGTGQGTVGADGAGVSGTSDSEALTAVYSMTDAAVVNPFIGFAVDATSKRAAQDYSLVYIDLTFRELQPESPGSFALDSIAEDNNVELWRSQGKHAVLRFVCDKPSDTAHRDIPDWLYELTGDGTDYDISYGKGYSPDYSNRVFIEYHRRAVEAIAEYFSDGFVSYVELGSLGHWGEWHVKREDGIVGMPKSNIRDIYVSQYVDAFGSQKLLMRRPFSSAKRYGLGQFNDMAGDPDATEEWLGWISEGGEYTQTGEHDAMAAMPDFWMGAPVGGELTSSYPMEQLCGKYLGRTLDLLRESHTSFIGPMCPVSGSGRYDGALYDDARNAMIGSMGYRLGVTSVSLEPVDGGFVARLTWENSGVAPLYFDLPAELSLYTGTQGDSAIYGDGADNAGGTNTVGETDSDTPIYTAAVDILLSELQPGDVFETVTFIPASLPACGELRLGIIDPMTGKAAVRLVSSQRYTDGGETIVYTFR